MGNCLPHLCSPHDDDGATPVLLSGVKRDVVALDRRIPLTVELRTKERRSRLVKILVTEEQLETMLQNRRGIRLKNVVVRIVEVGGGGTTARWRPSLSTIPEVWKY